MGKNSRINNCNYILTDLSRFGWIFADIKHLTYIPTVTKK